MWKRSAAALFCAALIAVGVWAQAQRQGLPPGPMQEKARGACLACHDARIILQQHMTRAQWAKDMDKMIRWGAPVASEDREAMIDYFAQNFGPAARLETPPKLAEAPGVKKVRAACLGCHDAGVIVEQRLDRRGWTASMNRMVRWGARIRGGDREALLNYLTANYAPPAKGSADRK